MRLSTRRYPKLRVSRRKAKRFQAMHERQIQREYELLRGLA